LHNNQNNLFKLKDLKPGNVYILNGFEICVDMIFFLIDIQLKDDAILTKRLYKDAIFEPENSKEDIWLYKQLNYEISS
jgi:hypothetical protein